MTLTSRVAEFNDLDALEQRAGHGDVAAVLMEPALTNVGIVLPEPGYLDGVRALTRNAGVLLINDETHTLSAGPGGCTRAWSLDPDIVTVGKAIGGGIPAAAYGLSAEVVERLAAATGPRPRRHGGVGGTLAGNALSLAAARATLCEVLTDAAFDTMIARSARYTAASSGSSPPTPRLVRRPARRPLGVPLRQAGAAQRHGVRAGRRTSSWRTTCTCTC